MVVVAVGPSRWIARVSMTNTPIRPGPLSASARKSWSPTCASGVGDVVGLGARDGGDDDNQRRRIAVIGGGAAGLAAAKVFLENSAVFDVCVFEARANVGGVWDYNAAQNSANKRLVDIRKDNGAPLPSPMYRSLRTNLPREVMAYMSFPFASDAEFVRDARRYPTHEEVQRYLEAYADAFHLNKHIRLDTEVVKITRSETRVTNLGPAWDVLTNNGTMDTFDAVVVANGHYALPRIPSQLTIEQGAPSLVVHSVHYNDADHDAFRNKRVVVVGTGASGVDIAMEVAEYADEVILCYRRQSMAESTSSCSGNPIELGPTRGTRNNIRDARVAPTHVAKDGTLTFEDGSVLARGDFAAEDVVVVLATGYHVSFPFLDADNISWDDNNVRPLVEHIFPAQGDIGPTLSFIGLPWKVVPFPLFECQALWISKLLAGDTSATMPSDVVIKESVNAGRPAHHSHMLGDLQWDYNLNLLSLAGISSSSARQMHRSWRQRMYDASGRNKRARGDHYRDESPFDELDLDHAREEEVQRAGGINLCELIAQNTMTSV
ncbi:flavin-containing monooxygenase [Pseudoscourfieldia marina]